MYVSCAAFFNTGNIAHATTADDVVCSQCVDNTDITNGTITAGKIAPNAITTGRIAVNAITTVRIKPGAVNAGRLALDAVVSSRIKDGEVRTQDLRNQAVTEEKLVGTLQDKINDAGGAGNSVGDMRYWTGTSWSLMTPPSSNEANLRTCIVNGTPQPTFDLCTYTLGGVGPAGGFVIQLSPNGKHGFEVAREAFKDDFGWGCFSIETGATGKSAAATHANWSQILMCDPEANSATGTTADYEINGFDDWSLAPNELASSIVNNNAAMTEIMTDVPGLGLTSLNTVAAIFGGINIWTSSEVDSTSARGISVMGGVVDDNLTYSKLSNLLYAVMVRKF